MLRQLIEAYKSNCSFRIVFNSNHSMLEYTKIASVSELGIIVNLPTAVGERSFPLFIPWTSILSVAVQTNHSGYRLGQFKHCVDQIVQGD